MFPNFTYGEDEVRRGRKGQGQVQGQEESPGHVSELYLRGDEVRMGKEGEGQGQG